MLWTAAMTYHLRIPCRLCYAVNQCVIRYTEYDYIMCLLSMYDMPYMVQLLIFTLYTFVTILKGLSVVLIYFINPLTCHANSLADIQLTSAVRGNVGGLL